MKEAGVEAEAVREVYGLKHVSVIIREIESGNPGADGGLLSDILPGRRG